MAARPLTLGRNRIAVVKKSPLHCRPLFVGFYLALQVVSLLVVAPVSAAQHRSAWMWQKSSHPYGSAMILGDAAKEAEVITKMGAWGFDRVYVNTGTRSITTPAVVANWNASLDDVGIDVQFLISRFDAAIEPGRTNLLDRVQSRLIDYNNGRVDLREHFDAVHLDIEPHTTDIWDNGSPAVKRDQLLELGATYMAVRALLDAGGQADVKIYADIPVWYDSSSSIGWTDTAERDQWFTDISVPLDGLTMMAYERSRLSSIVNGVTYEASNFAGEVRVGLNNKEIGSDPGDTFEDFAAYSAMLDAVDDDTSLALGGVDHHTFYLLAELSPDPLISADFDADGDIDGADFLALQRGYGLESMAVSSDGDADDNGAVNLFDFLAWKDQYSAPPVTLATVPEPNAEIILWVALVIVSPARALWRISKDSGDLWWRGCLGRG